jgi:alpha-1,6-mannosyltransferase
LSGTSLRARWALAVQVAGYLALAVVAGTHDSPLTVPLPAGARPPSWATHAARSLGLDRLDRSALTAVAWALVLVVMAAFAVVLVEARARRVSLSAVLIAAGTSLAISVAAPVLLSRDVYTYAVYGRIETVYGRNPYTVPLGAYRHDPFGAVASAQWLHAHSPYGPAFTLLSGAISKGSPGATILAFKLLAGIAVAAATGLVALAAVRTWAARAPLAAALVGLNPVIVVHTVGGAHVDALIALPLAAALALAVTRPPPVSARALGVTLLLTLACLVKTVIVPVLALWLWRVVRESRQKRVVLEHLAVVVIPAVAAALPFLAGRRSLAPFASLGGLEAWASPSHLVGRLADGVAGADAALAVKVAFLVLFVVLLLRLARRPALVESWGAALLLLALSLPYLLPWYATWFVPFLGLLADEALLLAGTLATVVLGLTLIPADPFRGFTSPAVLDGVHYAAAPVLLALFVLAAARVLGRPSGLRRQPARPGLLEV